VILDWRLGSEMCIVVVLRVFVGDELGGLASMSEESLRFLLSVGDVSLREPFSFACG
jgi:hypothetical protein